MRLFRTTTTLRRAFANGYLDLNKNGTITIFEGSILMQLPQDIAQDDYDLWHVYLYGDHVIRLHALWHGCLEVIE